MRRSANKVSLTMRLAIPDLDQEGQIHQTGIGLINLLSTDLFGVINQSLEQTDGIDWLTKYRKSSLVYQNYNFNDPSNLLKELLRVSTSPLRKPIKDKVPQKDILPFLNVYRSSLMIEMIGCTITRLSPGKTLRLSF